MAALSSIALAGLTAAGAVSQYAGQRKQAGILEREGEYTRDIYVQNAALAELQADDAIARGREAEFRQRSVTKQVVGGQRASMAAQGIDISTGSALDVVRDTEALGELDALTIRNNAAREAWGHKVYATQYLSQGAMAYAGARNQARALRHASLGSLLTGAAGIADIYRKK